MRRFVIIGNGKMAMDCIEHILQTDGCHISLVVYDRKLNNPSSSIAVFLESKGVQSLPINKLNTEVNISIIREKSPDFILNINSFKIIKENLLKVPKRGIINFHNGPLPKYGGVNIPFWAIINGEKIHGITWHFVDQGIDTGDILWQKLFPVDQDVTAGKLMMKCIYEGIYLFKKNFYELVDDSFKIKKQTGKLTYFTKKDIPDNNAYIDLRWRFKKINFLVRGLNNIPFPNNFMFAKLRNKNEEIIINKISYLAANNDPLKEGIIVEATKNSIQLACRDSVFEVNDVMSNAFKKLNNDEVIKKLNLKKDCFLDNYS